MTINELAQLFIATFLKQILPLAAPLILSLGSKISLQTREGRDLQLNNQMVRAGDQGGGAESQDLYRRLGSSKNRKARGARPTSLPSSLSRAYGAGGGEWGGGRRRLCPLGGPRTLSPSPLEDRINEPWRGSKQHVPTLMNPHPRRST